MISLDEVCSCTSTAACARSPEPFSVAPLAHITHRMPSPRAAQVRGRAPSPKSRRHTATAGTRSGAPTPPDAAVHECWRAAWSSCSGHVSRWSERGRGESECTLGATRDGGRCPSRCMCRRARERRVQSRRQPAPEPPRVHCLCRVGRAAAHPRPRASCARAARAPARGGRPEGRRRGAPGEVGLCAAEAW